MQTTLGQDLYKSLQMHLVVRNLRLETFFPSFSPPRSVKLWHDAWWCLWTRFVRLPTFKYQRLPTLNMSKHLWAQHLWVRQREGVEVCGACEMLRYLNQNVVQVTHTLQVTHIVFSKLTRWIWNSLLTPTSLYPCTISTGRFLRLPRYVNFYI